MKISRAMVVTVVGLWGAVAHGADEKSDPVLDALAAEVKRSAALKMDGMDAPYYLSATSDQSQGFHVRADLGELLYRFEEKHRDLTANVRVGTQELDDSNFVDREAFSFDWSRSASPVDADPDALRQALWLTFDSQYKKAVEAIAKKRAYLQTNVVKDRPADFAPATESTLLLPAEKLTVDKERWTQWVKKASSVFRNDPNIHVGQVTLAVSVAQQHFVDSEGFRHRYSEPRWDLTLEAKTQATDGMPLEVRTKFLGQSESDMPSLAQVLAEAQKTSHQLDNLLKAQTLQEDYTGPVLFTGKAAATFFLVAIGDSLSHPRQPLGGFPVRGRLTERLNKHVATKLLTVKDDPTQKTWKGQPLLGHFAIDDDCVKPQAITLIDHGILKTYYMSRVPTKDVTHTNGHSRAGRGSVGNMFVEAQKPRSRAELKKELLELAAEEDLDYGILIDQLDEESYRSSDRDGSFVVPPPMVAYRVFKDGHEELVRGVTIKNPSFRALKDITALGNDPVLLNTQHHGQWMSVVAPSVLIKELELGKPEGEFEKPPFSPRPALSASVP